MSRYSTSFLQKELGWNSLHLAAYSCDSHAVQRELRTGLQIGTTDKIGATALHYAVWKGNDAIVRMFLEARAQVILYDYNGNTPLDLAAHTGHVALVELLLDHHVATTQRHPKLENALRLSTRNGHWDVTVFLLTKEIYVHEYFAKDFFRLAVAMCQHKLVKILEQKVASFHLLGENQETLLHVAAISGSTELVALFLCHIPVNAPDFSGRTPLHYAALRGHEAIVSQLINAHADVFAQDFDGFIPAVLAASRGHSDLMLAFLLAGGIVPPAKESRETPGCSTLLAPEHQSLACGPPAGCTCS